MPAFRRARIATLLLALSIAVALANATGTRLMFSSQAVWQAKKTTDEITRFEQMLAAQTAEYEQMQRLQELKRQ